LDEYYITVKEVELPSVAFSLYGTLSSVDARQPQ
jgi:hypothetical protein